MTSPASPADLTTALPSLAPTPTLKKRSSSTHRTVIYTPCLRRADYPDTLRVTSSRRDLHSVAVSFSSSALLHTQLLGAPTPSIHLRLSLLDPDAPPLLPLAVTRALWHGLWLYFAPGSDSPNEYRIELPLPSGVLHDALGALGARHEAPHYVLERSAVWQNWKYASALPVQIPFPFLRVTMPDGREHPLRPTKAVPGTVVYSRQIPHLSTSSATTYYALHMISVNLHLNLLHKWLNDERIKEQFWEQEGTWEQHEQFVLDKIQDKHTIALVGSYLTVEKVEPGMVEIVGPGPGENDPGEREAGYGEVYWVTEDRLGKKMIEQGEKVGKWDRGIHMFVGSPRFRGPHRVRAWLPSLIHYCFLDEPRTERVVAEPNEKNEKMIEYLIGVGFKKKGEIRFEDRVAVLMVCEKEEFYELCPF